MESFLGLFWRSPKKKKKEKEISNVKVNDLVITKDNKVGILKDYHRNLDYPSINDDIIYVIEDTGIKNSTNSWKEYGLLRHKTTGIR